MSELDHLPSPLVPMPVTGLVVDLHSPEQVVAGIDEAQELRRRIYAELGRFIDLLTEALVEETLRQGTKTIEAGGLKASLSGGEGVTYDPERLMVELRSAGMPEERIAEIVVEKVAYEVKPAKALQAARANPAYAEAVKRASSPVTKKWAAKVSRA